MPILTKLRYCPDCGTLLECCDVDLHFKRQNENDVVYGYGFYCPNCEMYENFFIWKDQKMEAYDAE